jgi:Uma2 family endonuclease
MAPLDVVLSPTDTYQPDVVFVAEADASVITDKHIRGVPTWVVEVVSDPVRDLRDKREIYMRFGIPEYWAVDPELRRVDVFRPALHPQTVTSRQLAPGVLRNLVVDLLDVFGPDKRPRRL